LYSKDKAIWTLIVINMGIFTQQQCTVPRSRNIAHRFNDADVQGGRKGIGGKIDTDTKSNKIH
jgi:hypothetical protein